MPEAFAPGHPSRICPTEHTKLQFTAHFRPSRAINLRGCMARHYDHPDAKKATAGTRVMVRDFIANASIYSRS
jgi:hypothetical protein